MGWECIQHAASFRTGRALNFFKKFHGVVPLCFLFASRLNKKLSFLIRGCRSILFNKHSTWPYLGQEKQKKVKSFNSTGHSPFLFLPPSNFGTDALVSCGVPKGGGDEPSYNWGP